MDPSTVFCPNKDCRDKGQQGRGNSGIHSRKKQRYRCTSCGKTCAATRGTALYRLHHPVELMVLVVTLLCHGCPTQAIVAAFGLDERTVAAWLHRAGGHAARVHAAVVETGQVELGQVQVDEICVKVRKGAHRASNGGGCPGQSHDGPFSDGRSVSGADAWALPNRGAVGKGDADDLSVKDP